MLIIGSHVSYGKEQLLSSVKEALEYNANTFMFYTGAPTNTVRKDIDKNLVFEAKKLMNENGIDIKNIVVHAPYIVNPATNDSNKREFAINFLKQEIKRCSDLEINKIVLHPGSGVGISKEEALDNIVLVLNEILDNKCDVKILIETMAGKGNECGRTIEEIAYVINNVKYKEKIGVCIDTCHINDAGYDLNNFDEYLKKFDELIGIEKIGCVHINDSKNPIGSHKDRHENFGFGTIGFNNLIKIIYDERLLNVPKILETPYVSKEPNEKTRDLSPYKYEIEMIKSKVFNDSLMDKIRNDSN